MAPHPNTKIWLALRGLLESANPKPAYAYPGELFSPGDSTFVRVGFLPHEPRRVEIGRATRSLRTGLLTLVVDSKLSSTAGEVSLGIAEELADLFTPDTPFCYMDTCVQFLTAPHVSGGFHDNGRWQIPVSVSWRSYS